MKTILLHRSEDGEKIAVLDGNNKEISHIFSVRQVHRASPFDEFDGFEKSDELPEDIKHIFDTHAAFDKRSIIDTLQEKLDNKVKHIIVEGEDLYDEVIDILSQRAPQYVALVTLHDEPTDLFEKHDATLSYDFSEHSHLDVFKKASDNGSVSEPFSLDNHTHVETTGKETRHLIDAIPEINRQPEEHTPLTRSRTHKGPIENGSKQSPIKLITLLIVAVILVGIAISLFTS